MSLHGRIVSAIFSISIILISVGCNRDNGCDYFGTSDDLHLSYYSYECDNGIRNGFARVEYLPAGDFSFEYDWDIEGAKSVQDFINLEGSGPMTGFVRVKNLADGCFIFKNVDMLFDMPHGKIGNKVWVDSGNETGILDSQDEPAPDVQVDLLDKNKEVLDSQVTNEKGYYLFEDLPHGEYIIQVHKPQGYTFCPANIDNDIKVDSDVDAQGYSQIITLSECESNLSIDAGLLK